MVYITAVCLILLIKLRWPKTKSLYVTVYFSDIGHPCYDQLTPVKTLFPLTSIMWPYRGVKVYSSSRSHVFSKLTADQLLVFRLDRGLMPS